MISLRDALAQAAAQSEPSPAPQPTHFHPPTIQRAPQQPRSRNVSTNLSATSANTTRSSTWLKDHLRSSFKTDSAHAPPNEPQPTDLDIDPYEDPYLSKKRTSVPREHKLAVIKLRRMVKVKSRAGKLEPMAVRMAARVAGVQPNQIRRWERQEQALMTAASGSRRVRGRPRRAPGNVAVLAAGDEGVDSEDGEEGFSADDYGGLFDADGSPISLDEFLQSLQDVQIHDDGLEITSLY